MSQSGKFTTGTIPGTFIETVTGTSGGAISPDGSGNINILGMDPITTPGNAGLNTLYIVVEDASDIQKGVIEIATNAETIAGTDPDRAVVPSSLTAKLGAQTDNGIAYGNGAAAPIEWTAAGTDGQLIIAATGLQPAFATLTSSGGTIDITSGANTLNIDVDGTVSDQFTTLAGIAVPAAGNLNIYGSLGQGVNTTGAGSTVTITNLDASTGQKGVTYLATNAEAIAGTDTTKIITADDLKAKLGTQTNHGVLVGASTTAAVTALSVGTNGQVLLGSSAADPAFGTLTSSDSSIAFTIGAASLSLQVASGTTVVKTLTGNSGGAISPTAGNINILGSGSTTVAGSGSTLTISVAGGITWTVTTVDASIVVNNGYIANKAGLLTMTLPASATVGDLIEITGINTAVGWRIAQNANQQIFFGSSSTTLGAAGYLEATAIRDSVKLVCVVAGASSVYNVLHSIGNITVN